MRPVFVWAVAFVLLAVITIGVIAYLAPDPGNRPGTQGGEQKIDLTVSDNVVMTSNGSVAFKGHDFTEALRWALTQEGRSVSVPAGNYDVTDSLSLASNVTLVGNGDGPSGTVFNFTSLDRRHARVELLNVDNVTLKQFRIIGNGNVHMRSDGVHGQYSMENITVYRTSVLQPGAFMTWTSDRGVIDDLSFVRCKAIETSNIGFNLQGDGGGELGMTAGGWVRNVTFQECVATYCGYYERFNGWVCGFDLAEGTNVENLHLIDCVATHNWVDGFHFEVRPSVINCTLENCIAGDNSQREPDLGVDYRWNKTTQDVRLLNSTGSTGATPL
jgi:hypothetical protein